MRKNGKRSRPELIELHGERRERREARDPEKIRERRESEDPFEGRDSLTTEDLNSFLRGASMTLEGTASFEGDHEETSMGIVGRTRIHEIHLDDHRDYGRFEDRLIDELDLFDLVRNAADPWDDDDDFGNVTLEEDLGKFRAFKHNLLSTTEVKNIPIGKVEYQRARSWRESYPWFWNSSKRLWLRSSGR